MVFRSSLPGDSEAIGIFETAFISPGMTSETSKVAFVEGSSQHGKALLASVDSN